MPVKIPPEVAQVLARSDVRADRLTLPPGQLERALYTATNKVIEALGGKWNRGQQAHLFTQDPRPKIAEALGNGSYTDSKKEFQFFETPIQLAERMVDILDPQENHRVLEPSAGAGAILRILCHATDSKVYYCELNEELLPQLEPIGGAFLKTDFLAYHGKLRFDRICMNPPFSGGQDIAHILHAYTLLAVGGTMVAISSPSWEFNTASKFVRFRGWFEELEAQGLATRETLPEGTFKESGTNVRALLLTIGKGKTS